MPTQKFTKQDVDQLDAWFQRRYEAQFAWKSATTLFQQLTGLRAYYPMSALGTAGEARDLGGSRHTT